MPIGMSSGFGDHGIRQIRGLLHFIAWKNLLLFPAFSCPLCASVLPCTTHQELSENHLLYIGVSSVRRISHKVFNLGSLIKNIAGRQYGFFTVSFLLREYLPGRVLLRLPTFINVLTDFSSCPLLFEDFYIKVKYQNRCNVIYN